MKHTQRNYLKGKFVFLFVREGNILRNHFPQVVFHKIHGEAEALLDLISCRCIIVIAAELRISSTRRQDILDMIKKKQIKSTHKIYSLINCDFRGNLRPQASVFDRRDLLLRVTVHVHVQHQTAERCPQVIGQVLVRHAVQDQIHVQLTRDLVDGQVLTIQTHPCKKIQLAPGRKYRYIQLLTFSSYFKR